MYTATISRYGYRDVTVNLDLTTNSIVSYEGAFDVGLSSITGNESIITVILRKPSTANIYFKVYKGYTEEPLSNVKSTLYFSNGTMVSDTLQHPNPQYTTSDGIGWWKELPVNDSYYFTMEATGYTKYISPTFVLTNDKSFTIYLLPSTALVLLRTDTPEVGKNIDVFVYAHSEGVLLPIMGKLMIKNDYYRERLGRDYYCTDVTLNYAEDNFTIPYGCLQTGVNIVYIDFTTFTSNTIAIKVVEVVTPAPGMNMTEIIPGLPTAYNFLLNIFFTPIFLATIIIAGIATYIESKAKSNGMVFISIMLIGIVVLGLFGVYPAWVTVLLFILVSAIVVVYMQKMYRGG
jgi:hypothetical protein